MSGRCGSSSRVQVNKVLIAAAPEIAVQTRPPGSGGHQPDREIRRPILASILAILIIGAQFIGRDVQAAGQVTGVAVSPNPVTKPSTGSAAVAVTITGTGSCAEIEVDYGDTNLQRLPVGQFPLTLSHLYGRSGQFRVAARGARDCAGAVQTTLTIGLGFAATTSGLAGRLGKFEHACQLIQCRCALPTIDKIVPFVSSPEPAGTIVLQGCGFGTDRNVFSLFLHLVDYRRRPLAPIELRVLSLRNNSVVAEIPVRIAGVLDQQANLEARRSGQVGPLFSIGFRATQNVALLSRTDPVVRLLPAPFTVSDSGLNIYVDTDTETFSVQHMNTAMLGDQSGTDAWLIELSNDWVFDHFWFTRSVDPGELQVSDPTPPFPDGFSNWYMTIGWWVSPGDSADYDGLIRIKGPEGVPWSR